MSHQSNIVIFWKHSNGHVHLFPSIVLGPLHSTTCMSHSFHHWILSFKLFQNIHKLILLNVLFKRTMKISCHVIYIYYFPHEVGISCITCFLAFEYFEKYQDGNLPSWGSNGVILQWSTTFSYLGTFRPLHPSQTYMLIKPQEILHDHLRFLHKKIVNMNA
jgi:hypothetical protein